MPQRHIVWFKREDSEKMEENEVKEDETSIEMLNWSCFKVAEDMILISTSNAEPLSK